jgi:hypothetical protein
VVPEIQEHIEGLGVPDLVGGDEPRADGAESVAALALVPLRATLHLERALGDVVHQHVARNRVERLALAYVAGGAPDHHAQLDLPVSLQCTTREHDVIIRAVQTADRLGEHRWLFRDRQICLPGMVCIVEPDGDEFADASDRDSIARGAPHQRQGGRLESRQPGATRRCKGLGSDVVDMCG